MKIHIAIATTFVCAFDTPARAQNQPSQPGVLGETIVVAAPRLEEDLPIEIEQSGARVQTITSEQIENGGYDDVGQTLQALIPGLFVTPTAGAFSYVAASLQGSRSNEILWLVDGVRISNRLYNGTMPLDTLPSHMIERIEVIESAQGLFYGTQAVAGVINIVTKAFTENGNGRLESGFDTNKGRHVNGFARDSKAGHRFVFYGSVDQADGFNSFPDGDYQPSTSDRHRGYDVATLGGKYSYDLSKQVRVSTMYQRSDVSLDLLRAGRTSASQAGGPASRFNDRTEHIFSSKLDYTARDAVKFFFKGYYHQWDSLYNETQNVIGDPETLSVISVDEFWGFKDYGANLLAKFTPTPKLEYFAGYDFQRYSGQDDVLLIEPTAETVNAVFGQVRTTRALMPKGTIAVGARFNAPMHSDNALVWNVTGQYDFTQKVFARGSVGTAFRYPDAYELFAVDPTCPCFGNPDLKPETSTNFSGSIGTRLGSGARQVNLEAIAFFRTVTDLIADVEIDPDTGATMTQNLDNEVRARGVTLAASTAFGRAITGTLGYTYTNSQRNDLAGGYTTLPGIPDNQVVASMDYHPPSVPVGGALTVNWVGRFFDTVSGFGSVPGGHYAIVDLSGRVFLDGSRRHRINFRLENLFDEAYTTVHGRGVTDESATPYLVRNLGTPLTLHLSYSFSY